MEDGQAKEAWAGLGRGFVSQDMPLTLNHNKTACNRVLQGLIESGRHVSVDIFGAPLNDSVLRTPAIAILGIGVTFHWLSFYASKSLVSTDI